MINISFLVPNVEELLKRSPEELAYPMLRVIDSMPRIGRHRQNFLITPGIATGYPSEFESRVLEVLNEEWEWLRAHGYINPQRDNSDPDFIDISRAGRKLLEDHEKARASARGPDGSREDNSGDSTPDTRRPSAGLSKALTELPAWARAVISARCAARAVPLFVPVKSRPKENARADTKAVESCWKVAALAAGGRHQSKQLVESLVAAATDALSSTTDEQNSSSDAAGLAIAAARCSQEPENTEPSSISEAVTSYELAFARFAEGKGSEYSRINLRATRCLSDDLAAVERLVAKSEPEVRDEIDRALYRPLWQGVFNPSNELHAMIEPWRIRLLELGLLDIYSSHMALLEGLELRDPAKLQGEVNAWAADAGVRVSTGIEYVNLDAKVVAPPSTVAPPMLRMLADVPIEDETADLLGFKAYAHALAGLIDNPETKTPLTLAINAPWGAGKTSLARMIKTILERKPSDNKERRHITCWFDAWMHDDAPNLAGAFAAEVARTADRRRSRLRRFISPVPTVLLPISERRHPLLRLLLLVVLLSSFCFAEWYFPLGISLVTRWVALSLGLAAVTVMTSGEALRVLGPFARAVASFVRDPYTTAGDASMKEVSSQLHQLIEQATNNKSKFVIFVDDLERCRPPRAVDVLEVVNQLLNHEGVVTVVMGEMAAIALCAEAKYMELVRPGTPSDGSSVTGLHQSYGREYLDKIIQLQFDLPPYSATTIQDLMKKIASTGRSGTRAKRSVLKRLLGGVLRVPKGIWDRRRIGRARQTISKEIEAEISSGQKDFAAIQVKVASSLQGTLPPQELEDLTWQGVQRRLGDESDLMEQAVPFLGYVYAYPRHAKRFLNRLRLLLYIAHERGTLDAAHLTPRHVAKWAALCERWPMLGTALSTHPHMMLDLEARPSDREGSGESFVNALSWLAPQYKGDSWLRSFLASLPRLAPIIERLVRLDAAPHERAA